MQLLDNSSTTTYSPILLNVAAVSLHVTEVVEYISIARSSPHSIDRHTKDTIGYKSFDKATTMKMDVPRIIFRRQ